MCVYTMKEMFFDQRIFKIFCVDDRTTLDGSVAIVSGKELPLDLTSRSDRSLIVKKRMTMQKGRHVRLIASLNVSLVTVIQRKEKKGRKKEK